MISQGIDAMFLNPAEAEGILPALDALKGANIPIVNFDTEVADMSYVTSYVGSDNYNAGYVCGEDLAKKVPDGGDILVLDSPTMQSVTDRTNGFLDAIKESGVTFNVVGQQDAQGNQQVANEKAQDLLTAHPDVVAIYGYGVDRIAEYLVFGFHEVIKQEIGAFGFRVIFTYAVLIGSYPKVALFIFRNGVYMFHLGVVTTQILFFKAVGGFVVQI